MLSFECIKNEKSVYFLLTSAVYPKHYFELGSLIAPYYCRHTNYNSWREQNKSKNFLKRIKRFAEKNTICWIIIRTLVNKKGEKYTSFYKYRKNK